jgi:formylglycine-generating enzyme required for sulfatase activity
MFVGLTTNFHSENTPPKDAKGGSLVISLHEAYNSYETPGFEINETGTNNHLVYQSFLSSQKFYPMPLDGLMENDSTKENLLEQIDILHQSGLPEGSLQILTFSGHCSESGAMVLAPSVETSKLAPFLYTYALHRDFAAKEVSELVKNNKRTNLIFMDCWNSKYFETLMEKDLPQNTLLLGLGHSGEEFPDVKDHTPLAWTIKNSFTTPDVDDNKNNRIELTEILKHLQEETKDLCKEKCEFKPILLGDKKLIDSISFPRELTGQEVFNATKSNGTPQWIVPSVDTASAAEKESTTVFLCPVTKLPFQLIPAGSFSMGSPLHEEGRYTDEHTHKVTITRKFWMGRTETTQKAWETVMENSNWRKTSEYKQFTSEHNIPSGDEYPIVFISWNDIDNYVKKLNLLYQTTSEFKQRPGYFRLPTEAEWEYAARSFDSGSSPWGGQLQLACDYANIADLAAKEVYSDWKVHQCNDGYATMSPVGLFKANPFGLKDMLGNVYEYVNDWYDENYFKNSPENNPPGPKKGNGYKVIRGGGWYGKSRYNRYSYRFDISPSTRTYYTGFRVVFVPAN